MKYVGFYTNGQDYDPRTKYFAKYECEACGHLMTDVQTSNFRRGTFIPKLDMKCADCGSYGNTEADKIKHLQDQIEELTKTKSAIEVKIETLVSQVNNLSYCEPSASTLAYEEKKKNSLLWNS